MARIAGVNLPLNKRAEIGLTYIYGIGRSTSSPAACSERIAVSLPDPGPLTYTSTFCNPCSMPLRAAASAVTCAANGVDLREPLKPAEPADSQTITLPSGSVRQTIVLLNDVLMCA